MCVCIGVGAALLRRPDKLARLAAEIAAGSQLPLTVKVRTGPGSEGTENVLELVQRLAESKIIAAVTIHGVCRMCSRAHTQFFSFFFAFIGVCQYTQTKHTCAHTNLHTHKFTHAYTFIHARAHTCDTVKKARARTHTHTNLHTHSHTQIYTHTNLHTHTHLYTRAHTHATQSKKRAHTHKFTHAYTFIHARTHTCDTCVCVCVCVCV